MASMRQPPQTTTPPLLPTSAVADQANTNRLAEILRIIFLGALMISCSAGVISFNKYLMAGPFPFAMHLVLGHMGFGSCLSALLYLMVPSLFPSLNDKTCIDRKIVVTKVMPIACFFAGSLVLSNMAYLYLSVPFLQMMKETNVVLVYMLSLLVGIEIFRWRSLGVLLLITAGTAMTVYGELHFVVIGVLMQVSSQIFEVGRLVLQSILLAGKGLKLDVMSYNLVVMPLCFLTLGLLVSLRTMLPTAHAGALASPRLSDFTGNARLLLANMLLAFCLNVVMALFIKSSSATSTVLAMILKDIAVVLSSVVFMSAAVSRLQVLGLSIQIVGVFTWSMMRSFPEKFELGIIAGYLSLVKGDKAGVEAPLPATIPIPKEPTNGADYGAASDVKLVPVGDKAASAA